MGEIFATSLKGFAIVGVFVIIFNFYEISTVSSRTRYDYTTIVTKLITENLPRKLSRKSKILLTDYFKITAVDQDSESVSNLNTIIDSDCKITAATKGTFKFIPLLSYPGSGNTWLQDSFNI